MLPAAVTDNIELRWALLNAVIENYSHIFVCWSSSFRVMTDGRAGNVSVWRTELVPPFSFYLYLCSFPTTFYRISLASLNVKFWWYLEADFFCLFIYFFVNVFYHEKKGWLDCWFKICLVSAAFVVRIHLAYKLSIIKKFEGFCWLLGSKSLMRRWAQLNA